MSEPRLVMIEWLDSHGDHSWHRDDIETRDWSKQHQYVTLLLIGLFITSLTFGRKRRDVAARMLLFGAGLLAGHFWW